MKIFVNGTFDILHRGHIELLKYSRSLGNQLLVAIDSDQRVKQLKGSQRPINDQNDRKFLLENLKSIDRVAIFNSDQELIDIIKNYHPDIMVKGSDYQNQNIIGSEYCKEIKFYDRTEHSTTKIIQHIIDRR